jgi:parvulin-like peptidyl-prolyl isomerase
MRAILNFVFVLLVAVGGVAQVVDRIVAVVNKQVILQSELEQAADVEFLLQGKSLDQLTSADLQAVLDRLIDQDLLQQQIVNRETFEPTQEEVATRIREMRANIPGAIDDEKWKAMIATYGVTLEDVQLQVRTQILILKLIDIRFRNLAHVDSTAVSDYYQQKLLPELRKQGAPEPPLSQVSDKIEKILTEQRIDDLLNSWLQTLRSQAHIRKLSSGKPTILPIGRDVACNVSTSRVPNTSPAQANSQACAAGATGANR